MTRHRWLLGIILLLCHCITVSHSASGDDSDASYSFGSFFYDAKDWLSQKVNAVISTTSNAMLWLQEKYSSSSCYFDLFDPKLLTGINDTNFITDFQTALKEGNEKELVASIGKLVNLTQIMEDIRTSKTSKATCLACKLAMVSVQFLIYFKKKDREIASLGANICTDIGSYFEIRDRSVCDGMMNSLGLDAIYAFRYAPIGPAQMCQEFLGEDCSCGDDSQDDWKVALPDSKKLATHITVPPPNNVPKLKVLQITDIHYDPYYQPGSETDCDFPMCCRASTGWARTRRTAAGKWGDYRKCDSPKWLIENAFQHIIDTHKDIDYILWTGDVPPHDIYNQSREENLENLKVTTELIAKYFGNTTVLPAVGNHESFPMDSFVPPSFVPDRDMSYLYDQLAIEWSRWLPDYALETVRKGAFYSVLVRPGLRVISINGNYCERSNFFLMLNSTDPLGQLAWLVSELDSAEKNAERVHIINHVPPGRYDCLKTWSKNYYDIVNRYEATIMAQFYGHSHFDEFEVFYDTTDFKRPVNVGYIAPSITPWKDCNPAYRIYYVDGDRPKTTRAIIDFETWTMDLDYANDYDDPQWYKSYEARSEYNMESLLPQDWDNLIQRLSENRTLFDLYYRNYYRDTSTMPKCDHDCRKTLLCDLRTARSHDRKNLCKNL